MKSLSSYFQLRRRYTRSVNLERDLAVADSLQGYLPTPRGADLLERIAAALTNPRSAARAWTVTGVYGTGKSAFAHFAAALHGPANDPARALALEILRERLGTSELASAFERMVPDSGLVRAVLTGRREPLGHAIVRGLARGAENFWAGRSGRKPTVLGTLLALKEALDRGEPVDLRQLPELVRELSRASGAGVLVLIDEMGKVLEHAAGAGDGTDLYLLQQLAEFPSEPGDPPVLVFGLLHQAFSEYGHGLTSAERAEWDKIQGRFESVVFAEAPEQMLQLVAHAISADLPEQLAQQVNALGGAWEDYLRSEMQHPYISEVMSAERIASLYPLHPVTALVLPTLCAKYAQNDRSLFTFLTSEEPHSFARFLSEQGVDPDAEHPRLPVLKLPELYDYFIDVGGVGISARGQFQRWAEVHGLIHDAVGLSDPEMDALKVIGTLNLVTSAGPLRASRGLVLAALLERPDDPQQVEHWSQVIDELVAKRLVAYRRQIDELRVWEGSDFDVEGSVQLRLDAERRPLATILTKHAPLSPVVAERHSYRTGTLRYFERKYVDSRDALGEICASAATDGVIAYWIGEHSLTDAPATTADTRPLVVVSARQLGALRSAGREIAALSELERTEPALQTDGVARKEVRQRVVAAQRVLEQTLRDAFDVRAPEASADHTTAQCWVGGQRWHGGNFNAALSALCDRVYHAGPVLWNELLNRRDLTAQGAAARRELIEALVEHHTKEHLGLKGYGPEVSMYASALQSTGIHRFDDAAGHWMIGPPLAEGLAAVWEAMENFFTGSTEQIRSLDQLYTLLDAPPFGVKAGLIPVLIAAALIYHSDDVSLYRDGSFLPVLGPEQFEILVKQPARFGVKHLRLNGIRFELFRQLENVITGAGAPLPSKVRNTTLLGVVRPLIRFATALPPVTKKSATLSREAAAVRDALLSAREPDNLVFETLPKACGLPPFAAEDLAETTSRQIATFRRGLLRALTELENHYGDVLARCRARLQEAFAVSADEANLREHLRVRAQYLVGKVIEPKLKSFAVAAADADGGETQWISAVAMVVAQRPVDTWTEDDALRFEVNLSEIARRFTILESLQRDAAAEGRDGFDARRVAITRPDGTELHRLVWLDQSERDLIDLHVRRLVEGMNSIEHEHQRQAVAAALVERMLLVSEGGSANTAPHANVGGEDKREAQHG